MEGEAVANGRCFLRPPPLHKATPGGLLKPLEGGVALRRRGSKVRAPAWMDHVTRVWALSDRRSFGRALEEINFRGQRCSKPGGAWGVPSGVAGVAAVPHPRPPPAPPATGLGSCPGCARAGQCAGAHLAAWGSGAAAAAAARAGSRCT